MNTKKVKFKNKAGLFLGARLEMPIDQAPHTFALFAHCFTCNKNLTAVRNISRALTQKGVAVLRFDFTGLGESEGDFENTNFSSNVEDLLAATDFLKENYQPPTLLIGHSLGGAAIVFAAEQLPDIKALVTIGSPANPIHVKHLLESGIEEIKATGKAKLSIGGRPFTIKEQFLQDLETKDMPSILQNLRKAILILHSPQDNTVAIDNAAQIYKASFHPKSFVSLDGADHLLSNKEDSLYVGEVIASWVKRYVSIPNKATLRTNQQVVAKIGTEKYITDIKAGNHRLVADEPTSVGGNDYGPSPYELVSAGLGACTAMTLRMYADRKKWDLQTVKVHVQHSKTHAEDCAECEQTTGKIDRFERILEIEGNLDDKQRQRLQEIADKCPVHRTLEGNVQVKTSLKA